MFAANFVKHLSGRESVSASYVIQTLADAFRGISLRGNIEQTLIGSGVLYDGGGLPLHREHHGALAFP
jgi:hypothetical protein